MNNKEIRHILLSIIILTLVISFSFILKESWYKTAQSFFFAALIIILTVSAKKVMAHALDSDVEHEIWHLYRFGFLPSKHFKNPVPFGVLLPLIFSFFSLGLIKFSSILTYETRILKRRAAKRFGTYSYTAMTDWHNALIGASGIVILLLISIFSYFLPFEGFGYLAKVSTYYAFWNLIPISKLDGAQIFFGSRTLYSILLVVTLIFTAIALIVP
jgi:Zn-dependent protease